MNARSHHPLRRVLTPCLATFSLWAGLAVPIMDADGWSHGAVVESAHDPGVCVRGHDHTICTQVVVSRAAPTDGSRYHRDGLLAPNPDASPEAEAWPPHFTRVSSLGSRAPPAA